MTLDECAAALKSMPRNKSPGLDGLMAEFYRHFWDLLCDDLLAVYNSVFSSGRLSAVQRCGVVRLLYKKGDKEDLRNWRPTSLLNVDYKILSTPGVLPRSFQPLFITIRPAVCLAARFMTTHDCCKTLWTTVHWRGFRLP